MLRHGLSTYEFSRMANIAFVQGARDILREQEKSASFSRVSAITGLHRHVVSNIVNSIDAGDADLAADRDTRRNRLARVLSGWFESPEYTDREGRPLLLPEGGPAPSFAELVRVFSGDIYPAIVLDELLKGGAVRRTPEGLLEAVARRYSTGGGEPAAIQQLGTTARDFLATLEHNLESPADARLFEDAALATSLDPDAVPLFRRLVRKRASAFLADIEGWLREHEQPGSPAGVRAGLMMQMFVDDDPDADAAKDAKQRE
jgi:hypothetical protein